MQQHDVDDTTTRKSDQGKAWPPNTPGAQEAEDDIQQKTPTPENNTEGLGDKCLVATKQHRGIHKETLHQPQNTISLRDTRDNTTRIVFEFEPTVKLHSKNVEVETSGDGNPRQDQVTMGGFTVLDLPTTNALVMVGFSIMHQ